MIVVDASVAVKWFLQEPGHEMAVAVVESGEELIAPDLLIAEVMNVLRRKQRQSLLSSDQIAASAETVSQSFARFVSAADLVVMATSLSQALDHSIYDCFYMACAALNGCALLTADEVFAGKLISQGYDESVVKLMDWKSFSCNEAPVPDASILKTVLELHAQFKKTLDAVTQRVGRSFESSGDVKIFASGDLEPAFSSPSYVRLARYIAKLNRSDRARLLALGWLGQAPKDDDWSIVLTRAEAYLSDDPSTHLRYLISKIPLFEEGLRRFQAHNTHLPLTFM